ncbi:MAG: hypothetical protein JXR60_04430 [Bacteroidales bacterium]|nr:hypothetical protein [Bacteroidales bacterium]
MISHFFKLPRHRSFNYKPRFYDPELEKLEERKNERQANGEAVYSDDSEIKARRINIRTNYIKQKYAERKENRLRMYIRILTIGLLAAILYMIFDKTIANF